MRAPTRGWRTPKPLQHLHAPGAWQGTSVLGSSARLLGGEQAIRASAPRSQPQQDSGAEPRVASTFFAWALSGDGLCLVCQGFQEHWHGPDSLQMPRVPLPWALCEPGAGSHCCKAKFGRYASDRPSRQRRYAASQHLGILLDDSPSGWRADVTMPELFWGRRRPPPHTQRSREARKRLSGVLREAAAQLGITDPRWGARRSWDPHLSAQRRAPVPRPGLRSAGGGTPAPPTAQSPGTPSSDCS